MGYSHQISRRDLNHAEIRKALRDSGILFIDTADSRNGYDAITVHNGVVTFIEIKASGKEHLTDRENAAMIEIGEAGGRYRVVTNIEDAIAAARGEA